MERILSILEAEGNKKKTKLAGLANVNYTACMKYLHFMKGLGWLDFGSEHGGEVSITHEGRKIKVSFNNASSRDTQGHGYVDPCSGPGMESPESGKSHRGAQTGAYGMQEDDSPLNLLLIDDENDALMIYRLFLAEAGFNVKFFTDPERALRDFTRSPQGYDVVVTDIRMKPVNGLQLYNKIKRLNPSVKVIFISALDAAEELVSILPNISSDQIVRKPVGRKQFIDIIEAVCRK